jgi:heat-inducible transcriptional repressor
VVREYIETAQPVGSGHVADAPGVTVSSATVRNEMAALEQEGYLRQPHTSAGRVPTDKGYRFFVDHLTQPGTLDAGGRQQVLDFFTTTHGALEQMLRDTSRLLSGLTDYAAVVTGPSGEAAVVRSVQLVALSAHAVMVVAVLSNGAVENEQLDLPDGATDAVVAGASARLASHLVGRGLAAASSPPPSGDASVDQLCELTCHALVARASSDEGQVFVRGASRMAASFDAVDVVRNVLLTLEQQYVVVGLLRDVLDRGLSVAIGGEHGVEPLAACSVVVAPYVIDGQTTGTIGVLGPTRMNYPHALAAVEVVSERLSQRLSES